ncbi:MAG: glycosyltransferase family 4 protein [Cyanobacteria bacterium P01_D01_bin.56]
MKILFLVTRSDTVGGAQVHVKDLARALVQDQAQVLVLTGKSGYYNNVLGESKIHDISLESLGRSINFSEDWKTLFLIRKNIRSHHPDLVSTHSSKAGLLGRIACRLEGVPCLFTAHGWAFTQGVPRGKRYLYQALELLVSPLSEHIICVSDYDRHLGIQAGINPDRLITIHNGMPDIQPKYWADPIGEGTIHLTMIARFDQQKDHITLLQAIQQIENVHVNLVGDGPSLNNTKALVEQLDIEDKVSFWGFRSDIPEVLAQSQIFALISHWEGFPRTIIEAMRAGLPVVASQVGGVAEAVIDGETGFCVARQDVATLKERLAKLVAEPELRVQMGQAGRRRYEANFTFQRMYDQTCQVYERALARKGKL